MNVIISYEIEGWDGNIVNIRTEMKQKCNEYNAETQYMWRMKEKIM